MIEQSKEKIAEYNKDKINAVRERSKRKIGF